MSFPGPKGYMSHVPRQKNAALEKAYEGSDILSRHHHRTNETCSVKDFTKKRREILMLNMSINTQQEEIDKLHADLERKNQTLQVKEADLNDNLKRFDSFLEEEYQQKLMAATLLDKQFVERAPKEQAVEKLSQQISILESGIRKYAATIEQNARCKQLSLSLQKETCQHQQEAKKKGEQVTPTKSHESKSHLLEASQSNFKDEQFASCDKSYFIDLIQVLNAIKVIEEGNFSFSKKIQEREAAFLVLQK